ncbi:MAG: cobalt/nickel transport system permease protein [Clostridia bacterium]|nr:cobalt/nickel transport system permease protein [Clostridia bacterium]
MFTIDQYAYTNRLRVIHPGEKMAFALITLLIALIAPNLVIPAIIIFLMAGITIGVARIPVRFYLKLFLVPFSFLIAGIAMIALIITTQSLAVTKGITFLGWTIGVTPASIQLAGKIFCKSLGAVSCLYFLSLTTPMTEIISVLRKLHVPALLVDLISLNYRFIFVLLSTVDDIYTAQASRLGYVSLRTSYYSLGHLAVNLFIKTYKRSRELFVALTSRGYNEELKFLEVNYPFSWLFLFLAAGLDLALISLTIISWR